MIIKDIQGDKLTLTKTQLIETKGNYSVYPFRLNLADLRKEYTAGYFCIRVYGKDACGLDNKVCVGCDASSRELGCRRFSPEVFAKIIKAAGIRTTLARKAKRKTK